MRVFLFGSRLRVERIVPPSPPDGSMWRRNKLPGPAWLQPPQLSPQQQRQLLSGVYMLQA